LKACCLQGALSLVEADQTVAYDALSFLDGVNNDCNITFWNDQPGRTKEEVLALLDKLIAKA
jgi:hypothetical protein